MRMTDARPFALFIHRRDLRLPDNRGLADALAAHGRALGCFILDPKQVGEGNEYRSGKQVRFMRECLAELDAAYRERGGRLHVLAGDPAETLAAVLRAAPVAAVYVNADYSPYAVARDRALEEACASAGVPFVRAHDALLCGDPAGVTKDDGKPYTVFTPFWKRAAQVPVPAPAPLPAGELVAEPLPGIPYGDLETLAPDEDPSAFAVAPGRAAALAILARAAGFADYDRTRDLLALPTTRLSAHHKFGTISIRETYDAFGRALGFASGFVRQLYWRDFYTYLAYHIPRVIGSSYDPRHEILFGEIDRDLVAAWQEGRTGFPIVDAAMRELAATGYMHNRARLIAGSFLTKDLHQPWWIGEKHFARSLIDYDVSVNNGNWQWVGGTGTDPVPYFRIFNPWLQAKKFDPDAAYIHRWVPELRPFTAKQLHAIPDTPLPPDAGYPAPLVDHQEEMRKVKALYA